MANEIHIDYESGFTLYAVIRNTAGEVWNPSTQLFEVWGAGGHTADDYDISLADKGGDRYTGDFDDAVSSGRYAIQIFLQAGGVPVDTDDLLGSGSIVWTGNGELTSEKILAGKAVQSKLTGRIDYYDEDGQTIILTITPTEDESTLTRTPS